MRKGQAMNLANIGAIALALVLSVIVLGMGATILTKIQDAQTDTSSTLGDNESITWPGNNTAYGLVENRLIVGTETLWNATDKMVRDTHYTLVGNTLTFTNTSDDNVWVTDTLNITYSYKIGSEAYNSSDSGLTGVVTLAEFVPTIAIIAAAAIVIGILLLFFGRKKE